MVRDLKLFQVEQELSARLSRRRNRSCPTLTSFDQLLAGEIDSKTRKHHQMRIANKAAADGSARANVRVAGCSSHLTSFTAADRSVVSLTPGAIDIALMMLAQQYDPLFASS